jgi:hypothetical protein
MSTGPSLRHLLRPFALAAVLVLAGCATTDEVRDIVRASNYEMLVTADPALVTTVPADANKGPKPAPGAAERLTTFLQAHPDDPVLGPALHLRQALLYLNERQFELADASFNQIKGAKLTIARDEALVAAYPEIRWWAEWSQAGGGAFKAQRETALGKMDTLAIAAGSVPLKASPDVSDYLLEMRAWIGLKTAFAVVLPTDADFQKDTLEGAINAWTDTFAGQQLALVNEAKFDASQAFTLSTRRVLRLRTLLDTLATVVKSGRDSVPAPAVRFRSSEVQQYYESREAAH